MGSLKSKDSNDSYVKTSRPLDMLIKVEVGYYNLKIQMKKTFDFVQDCKLQLQLDPKDYARRQAELHQRTMASYEEKFESNLAFHGTEIYDILERKLLQEADAMQLEAKDEEPKEVQQHFDEFELLQESEQHIQDLLEAPQLSQDLRERLQHTQALIGLYPVQKSVREQILSGHRANQYVHDQIQAKSKGDYLFERQLVDREFYKRARIQTQNKKEARTIDRFEQQMRSGQELRRGARRKEFLKEVLDHQKEFVEYHKKKTKRHMKQAQLVKAHLEQKKKKEEHARDKEERERIKALQANDIDAYINLINTQKNSRLMQILEQTHKYLEQLGTKVVLQKNEHKMKMKMQALKQNKTQGEGEDGGDKADEDDEEFNQGQLDAYGNKVEDEELPESNEMDDNQKVKENLRNSSKIYYKITHSVQEEIKEQPHMIKFGKLKPYQMFGLNWLVSLYNNNLNGILADEMGLGKTIQTISLFSYLIGNKGNDGPFLVVVPLVTINNWISEFERWAPAIKVITYKGKRNERPLIAQQLKNEKYNVVLTTYEYILNDKSTLCKLQWQYIVVDEGHRMKNAKSKFAQTLGQSYMSAHRILLTGTPLQNNLQELWSLLNFLLPKIFSSCDEFKKWFDKPLSKVHHPLTSKSLQKNDPTLFELSEEEQLLVINRLHQVLRPFLLRRVKKDVEKELPPKSEMVIKVELSDWQKIVYNGILKGKLATDPNLGKGNQSLRNTMMQLRKICNHPYLFLTGYPLEDINWIYMVSGKFELLDRMLPKMLEADHKVLIFSQFVQLLQILCDFLDYRHIKYVKLDGGMRQEDRHANLQRFEQDKDTKVFLLSTRAGGHGINLQVSDTVIIFDSDFNPQMDEQAKDRAHRIGQKKEVRVYRLITQSRVESGILARATSKKDLDNIIIQAGMFNQKANDTERNNVLLDLLKQVDDKEDDEEAAEEVYNDEQLNEVIARDDKEFELFQSMDQARYARENRAERIKLIKQHKPQKAHLSQDKINYRLIQDWEVPQWIINSVVEEEKVDPLLACLGKRKRAEVNYKEQYSDNQWLKMVEAGTNPEDEFEKKRKRQDEQHLPQPDANPVQEAQSSKMTITAINQSLLTNSQVEPQSESDIIQSDDMKDGEGDNQQTMGQQATKRQKTD